MITKIDNQMDNKMANERKLGLYQDVLAGDKAIWVIPTRFVLGVGVIYPGPCIILYDART